MEKTQHNSNILDLPLTIQATFQHFYGNSFLLKNLNAVEMIQILANIEQRCLATYVSSIYINLVLGSKIFGKQFLSNSVMTIQAICFLSSTFLLPVPSFLPSPPPPSPHPNLLLQLKKENHNSKLTLQLNTISKILYQDFLTVLAL